MRFDRRKMGGDECRKIEGREERKKERSRCVKQGNAESKNGEKDENKMEKKIQSI